MSTKTLFRPFKVCKSAWLLPEIDAIINNYLLIYLQERYVNFLKTRLKISLLFDKKIEEIQEIEKKKKRKIYLDKTNKKNYYHLL